MTLLAPPYEVNTDSRYLRVFLVRHGQTDYNAQKILQGHMNIDINANGQDQAHKLAAAISEIRWDAIICSDLSRCRSTIAPLLASDSSLDVRYLTLWRERQMGDVEGMNVTDAVAKYGNLFRDRGESSAIFEHRIAHEWDRIQQDHRQCQNILVCTHGGTITMWVNKLHKTRDYRLHTSLKPEDLRVPFNTSVLVIDIDLEDESKSIVQRFGNTHHLGGQFTVQDQRVR